MIGGKCIPATLKSNSMLEVTYGVKNSFIPKFLWSHFILAQFYLKYLTSEKETHYFVFLSDVDIINVKTLRNIMDIINYKNIQLELFITKAAILQL